MYLTCKQTWHLGEYHVRGKEDKDRHGNPCNKSFGGVAALNMESAGTLPPAMAATMGLKTNAAKYTR